MKVFFGLLASCLFSATIALAGADSQHVFEFDTTSRILTPDLVEFIDNVTQSYGIPGLSLAVIHADRETEYGAWGIRTEEGDPMTTDTLTNIGSCSKAFLSAAIGILIDDFAEGRNATPLPAGLSQFDWDTKITHLLPGEWKLMDPWAEEKANVRDILSHVSGLPGHDLAYASFDTPADVTAKLRYLRPAFELRQRYSYNNQMYVVGAYIVSKYSGSSYEEFVENRIFRPLNMSASGFSAESALRSGKATQTWDHTGRRIPWWFTAANGKEKVVAGAGGVISSAEDLDKWVRLLLNSGVNPSNNNTIISESAFTEITTAHTIAKGGTPAPDFSIQGYGLGWGRLSYAGHDIIEHDGGLPGVSTYTLFAPSDRSGVVVLSNANDKHDANSLIAFTILRKVFGVKGDFSTSDLSIFAPPPSSPSPAKTSVVQTKYSSKKRVPLYDYTGSYYNPGYGSPLVLCNSSSTSSHCRKVLSEFKAVDSYTNSSHAEFELYASWSRFWTGHQRFVFVEDNRFTAHAIELFPNGYGKDKTPFLYEQGFRFVGVGAEFRVENGNVVGFGLSGTVGEKTNREKKGGPIEETADVWFVKL